MTLAVAVPAFATSDCVDGPTINPLSKEEENPCQPVKCGTQFTVETKVDAHYKHVKIVFSNNPGEPGNPNIVEITPDEGYKIVKVELKVDTYDPAKYKDYTENFPGKFNPDPGHQVNYAKVTVEKVCTPVCTDPKANNIGEVVEGKTVEDNTTCKYDPVATPSAPTPPTQLPNTGVPLAVLVGLSVLAISAGWAWKRTIKD